MKFRILSVFVVLGLTAGCAGGPSGSAADDAGTGRATTSGVLTAGSREFPAIPMIVIPEIVGVGPAQQAFEKSMSDVIDPVKGISVTPARCDPSGSMITDAGITSVDESGEVTRNGDEGIFTIKPDGSGTANFEGGIITVEADGSGTINGDQGIVTVEADGSGTFNGELGIISLDGKGAGTWNGDSGIIRNNGDGSGTWNGPAGIITIDADGSGTWNGDYGIIENRGDGTGTIDGEEVAMAPIPRVGPAGKFPPLKKFAPAGTPCGFIVTLSDAVLFDFDKADLRPASNEVLDSLAVALKDTDSVTSMQVRGHTDAKGSDAYNLDLSQRRADAVLAALTQRGVTGNATAQGFGESQPVAPNELKGADNPSGRQLNRRVEVYVRT